MNKQQLREEYENGQLDRPARIRYLSAEIEEHTDLSPPRRPGEIAEWWERKKAVFARRISAEEEDPEEAVDEQSGSTEPDTTNTNDE